MTNLLFSLLAAIPQPPSAGAAFQDPLPTPTPEWLQVITLQPGASLLLERSISYGDIAVVVAIMALSLIILFALYMLMPKFWKTR